MVKMGVDTDHSCKFLLRQITAFPNLTKWSHLLWSFSHGVTLPQSLTVINTITLSASDRMASHNLVSEKCQRSAEHEAGCTGAKTRSQPIAEPRQNTTEETSVPVLWDAEQAPLGMSFCYAALT